MRRRKAPARARGAAQSKTTVGGTMSGCAAGPTQGLGYRKAVTALRKDRLFGILFLMSLAALAGAYFGTSLLMWMLREKDVPQGQPGEPADELRSLRNTLALWQEQPQEMQRLRVEVAHLAAEMSTLKEEVQQMGEAIAAITEVSGWALKSAGAAIDLQGSPSSLAWPCRLFRFLCASPLQDTFVQPDASPGYCWPFQGSRSEVLIRLPTQIQPTALTIQHTSKRASPPETTSSAPRDFTVSAPVQHTRRRLSPTSSCTRSRWSCGSWLVDQGLELA